VPALAHASWVAYESITTITNAGTRAWTRETGMPSIWILGMFAPAADAKILVPFRRGAPESIVNDAYFGKISPDRLRVDESRGCVVPGASLKHTHSTLHVLMDDDVRTVLGALGIDPDCALDL
jgi:hypothetical protein